jgi:hypothetical protein
LYAFEWPRAGSINKSNLQAFAKDYADSVETCLGVDCDDMDEDEKKWSSMRDALWSNVCAADVEFNSLKKQHASIAGVLDELLDKRTRTCNKVRECFVETRYGGRQFGNCNEGASVLYCLAHEAGYKDIMVCKSDNDHVFTIFLDDSTPVPQICGMDRWEIELGSYFCGVTIVDGVLHYKGYTTQEDWYKKVTCEDKFDDDSEFTTGKFNTFGPKEWRSSQNRSQNRK